MMSKWGKRALAGVLSSAMIFTAVPAAGIVAFAEEEENHVTEAAEETEDEDESVQNEEKEEEEVEAEESEALSEVEEEHLEGAEVPEEDEIEDDKEVKELFHFTMDNTTGGLQSGDYSAEVVGEKISEDKDAKKNKSLKFEGGSWLKVTDSNGKSPLTGLDEITVNYFSKGGNGGAGWSLFAVRNDETPSYLNSEHYFGILDKKTSIKVERYKVDGGSRPATNDTSVRDEWKMVTVVLTEEDTTLYVNGEKVNTVAGTAKLTDILQDNSTFYIGKANWGSGEYFYGNLDEFSLYKGALSDEEILAKYKEGQQEIILSDEEKCQLAYDEIALPVTKNIKGNITLPTKNSYDAKVVWESSNPEIISDKATKVVGYDDMPAGVVRRGAEVSEVTLTATITVGDVEKTKTFDVTVAKAPEKKKLENYLFAFFPSNYEEQLYFAAGKDNLHFTDLNDGEPVLTSEIGDQGVRDPFIMKSAEGDHFYMIATDLKVQTTGWSVAQYGGSLRMLVWESDDLVNWSKPRLVDVGLDEKAFEDYGNVGCLWAPEAIYDEKTGEYVVFWASMAKDSSHQVTYYSKTRDFVNFTTAKKYIDRGDKQHCIDTSMVKANDGKYYRVSADTVANGGQEAAIILESSDSVLGNWEQVAYIEDIQPGMKNYEAYTKDVNKKFTGGVVEGPELFPLNDGKSWGLYMDNYGGIGYIPTTTTDISDTTGKSWTVYTSDQYDFGSLKKRHGSILGITADEYKAVMTKWGTAEEPVVHEDEQQEPVLSYDFETADRKTIADVSGKGNNGELKGNAKIVEDSERGNVLYLDGSGSFAEFPEGFFDNRDVCTVSFDLKPDTVTGNFFNFTFGKDNSKYFYLRARESDTYMAITKSSWQSEQGVTANTKSVKNKWTNFTVVFNDDEMLLYIDGVLSGTRDISTKPSSLGKNLKAYLGKSFYSGDGYVKGCYDNVKVYNRALSEKEIAKENNIVLEPLKKISSSDVTFVTQKLDKASKALTLFISKNNTKGDMKNAHLNFTLLTGAKVVDEEETYDLTKEFKLKVEADGETVEYTVKSEMCNNPLLGGQFADPDIDCFDGKYYIYPTTDGVEGWGGYQFHAFSSTNLVDWEDEGVILDLKQDADEKVLNDKGVEIAAVPWSNGNAWAPTIEKKNGMYYFYFCGHDTETNAKAIGVAYAKNQTGPFTVLDKPLISIKTCNDAGIQMGQAIDPSVFTDEDGTSYLSFGNGKAAIVKLNEDMISIDADTMENVTGLNNFRESLIITYRDGKYHYTWSCDDTGSENYSVAYGTSNKLGGRVDYRGMLLQKDTENDILGTGHHSILNIPGTDEWYICYHRFMTPLGQVSGGFGYHREVCLDKLTFDADGYMAKVTPTNKGITEVVYVKGQNPVPTPESTPTPASSGTGSGSSAAPTQSSGQRAGSSTTTTQTAPALTQDELTTIADALTPLGISRNNAPSAGTVNKKVAANTTDATTDETVEIDEDVEVAEEKTEDTSSDELTETESNRDIVDEAVPTSAQSSNSLSPAAVIVIILAAVAVLAGAAVSVFRFRKNK